jgi:hypothetical protein
MRKGRISAFPWRMDDEAVVYRGYEKIAKSGKPIACVHKGLYSPSAEILRLPWRNSSARAE